MTGQDVAIPQLPSRSLKKTIAFYERLGFKGEIVGPAQDYAILERGPFELHFFLHTTLEPASSSFSCYLRVHDVDALYRAFSASPLPKSGIPRLVPPEDKPWGMREFALIDEDGTLIRAGQVL
jgi:catechol 2,3-dioxygenase-like lactoylglutathione lyase family enzyme